MKKLVFVVITLVTLTGCKGFQLSSPRDAILLVGEKSPEKAKNGSLIVADSSGNISRVNCYFQKEKKLGKRVLGIQTVETDPEGYVVIFNHEFTPLLLGSKTILPNKSMVAWIVNGCIFIYKDEENNNDDHCICGGKCKICHPGAIQETKKEKRGLSARIPHPGVTAPSFQTHHPSR